MQLYPLLQPTTYPTHPPSPLPLCQECAQQPSNPHHQFTLRYGLMILVGSRLEDQSFQFSAMAWKVKRGLHRKYRNWFSVTSRNYCICMLNLLSCSINMRERQRERKRGGKTEKKGLIKQKSLSTLCRIILILFTE